MTTFDNHTLDIADDGRVEHLSYEGLLAYHQDGAIWGTAVGFRAMQAAGLVLSKERLWNRKFLSVISAHPGPGVRDAIEYVTRCVSRKRFQLLDPTQPSLCHGRMEYCWWVRDASKSLEIELRQNFVPSMFYVLVERIGTDQEYNHDEAQLEDLKTTMVDQLWQEPLKKLFNIKPSFGPILREMDLCTS